VFVGRHASWEGLSPWFQPRNGGPEDRKRFQEAGFDRHLVKPIGRNALEELVQSAAQGR
jgi:CheY-like chemotaxis protein